MEEKTITFRVPQNLPVEEVKRRVFNTVSRMSNSKALKEARKQAAEKLIELHAEEYNELIKEFLPKPEPLEPTENTE